MSLGEKLRNLRKEHHLTLEQMANMLNKANPSSSFNKGRLSKWENGNDEPRLSSLKQVADLFDVNIDYFFNDDESKPNQQSKAETVDLADDDDVIFTYKGKPLSKEDRELIHRLMNGKE